MYRNLIVIAVFFITNNCLGQVRFTSKPEIKVTADTTYYELIHTTYYSYYKQREDSIFIPFGSKLFHQFAAIDNKTKSGYFIIRYEDQIIFRYEVYQGGISGLGVCYHLNLLSTIYDLPYCQAIFKNGKLNGVVSFYDNNGFLKRIAMYSKGKFKGYVYDKEVKSSDELKQLNRLTTAPFEPKLIIMY